MFPRYERENTDFRRTEEGDQPDQRRLQLYRYSLERAGPGCDDDWFEFPPVTSPGPGGGGERGAVGSTRLDGG